MTYMVKDLIKENHDWKKEDFIFFWKIRKGKDVNKSCLSQWYPSEFIIDGRRYNCAEQYMMAQKALLFEDEESYKKIMASSEPKEIKSLGREVKGFDPIKWDEEKFRIVREGNFAKFTQRQDLRDYLISTEGKILVEASPYDNVWGIGMSESNLDILNPSKWKGQNLLGFILMDVRDEIIRRMSIPQYTTCLEDYYDPDTGDLRQIERSVYNSEYLAPPSVLWNQNLEIEEDYKKDKLLSQEMKNLLYIHRDDLTHLKNLFYLTEKELEREISRESYINIFDITEEDSGKFLVRIGAWNGLMAEPQSEVDVFGPFDSYSGALEKGVPAYIKIRTENEKIGFYNIINELLLKIGIDFEIEIKKEIEFIKTNNLKPKLLFEYSIKQLLELIEELQTYKKNISSKNDVLNSSLRLILCKPISEKTLEIIKNNHNYFNISLDNRVITNGMIYELFAKNFGFFIYTTFEENKEHPYRTTWANGFHNNPSCFGKKGFYSFDKALEDGTGAILRFFKDEPSK